MQARQFRADSARNRRREKEQRLSDAPITHIDPAGFAADPYPTLATMRASTPVTYVPELGATLFTRRDDIFEQESGSTCSPRISLTA